MCIENYQKLTKILYTSQGINQNTLTRTNKRYKNEK